MNITVDSIELADLDELVAFLKYNPKAQRSITSGFRLFSDIEQQSGGGKLFAKGIELDDEKVAKLLQIRTKFETDFPISIERTEDIEKMFAKRLYSVFKSMIHTRAARTEFRKIMDKVEKASENYIQDVLTNNNLVVMLYESYFIEKELLKKGKPVYFYHMVNTVIFSLAIVLESVRITNLKLTSEDIKNIITAAIMSNFSALRSLQGFIELEEDARKNKYHEINKGNFEIAKQLKYDMVIAETLEKICYYHLGEKSFIEKTDNQPSTYASIIVVAQLYDQKISGFFQRQISPKDAADRLYVMANHKEISKIYIDALAQGLKFSDLFDFYNEVERLIDMCLFKKSAKAYPMTGFLSSTLFVCGNNVQKCKHYSGAAKAINIIKKTSGLPEGSYGRCELLSPKLISFYEDHYDQIKDDVQERQLEKLKGSEEKSAPASAAEPDSSSKDKPAADAKAKPASSSEKKPASDAAAKPAS